MLLISDIDNDHSACNQEYLHLCNCVVDVGIVAELTFCCHMSVHETEFVIAHWHWSVCNYQCYIKFIELFMYHKSAVWCILILIINLKILHSKNCWLWTFYTIHFYAPANKVWVYWNHSAGCWLVSWSVGPHFSGYLVTIQI